MEIKKGDVFKCESTITIGGTVVFVAENIYASEKDGTITNELGKKARIPAIYTGNFSRVKSKMEFQARKVYRCVKEFPTTGEFHAGWLYVSPENGVITDGKGRRFSFKDMGRYFKPEPRWGIIKCIKDKFKGTERQFTAGRVYPACSVFGDSIAIQAETGFDQVWQDRDRIKKYFLISDDEMEITEKDLRGDIKDFPIEVVKAMLRRQQEQTGKTDVSVFQRDRHHNKQGGGFDWETSPEGHYFWVKVIQKKQFHLFSTGHKGPQEAEPATEWKTEVTPLKDLKEAFESMGKHTDKLYEALRERRREGKPTPTEEEIELFRKMMEAATVPGIPAPPQTEGMTERRVSDIANLEANKVYDRRKEIEMPLKDQLAKLGIHPAPVTVEVKTPKKETKKVENQHFLFPNVLKCLVARVNVALVGPAGSGKTSMVHNAANALDLPFYSKSVSAQTGVHEFFGYQDANGKFVRTLFREAYEKGGVFLVDEFDAGNPNVLAALNQATANGSCAFPDKMVNKHKDFIAVMAGNTFGTGATAEYVGRNKIDAATLDRFVFIEVPYDETLEMALATNKEWCRKVQQFRAQAEKKKVKGIISPRATFNGQAMLAAGMDEDFVLKTTVFKGLSEDEIRLLTESEKGNGSVLEVKGVSRDELEAEARRRLVYGEWAAEKRKRREYSV